MEIKNWMWGSAMACLLAAAPVNVNSANHVVENKRPVVAERHFSYYRSLIFNDMIG